jgi:ParB-like chromosome segregation protein Spo0J
VVNEQPGTEAAPPAPTDAKSAGGPVVEVLVPPPPLITPMPPPRKHHVAPAMVSLERVDADEAFRLRPDGDVSGLATDVARLGQLFPVDLRLVPPDRFQVITGFRRVAALRFLQRDKVLARLHTDLNDEDALLMSLAEGIHSHAVPREALVEALGRYQSQGRMTPTVKDMLEKALATEDGLAPEEAPGQELDEDEEEEEIDADELAGDVTVRLAQANQDLSLLADVFADLEPERRRALLEQLRYSSELVAFLEGKS